MGAALVFCPALVVSLAAAAPGPVTLTVKLQEYVTTFDTADPDTQERRKVHASEYFGRVAVGKPPQLFDVVFDTGSGNVVLPTTKCSDEACQRHRRYLSQASSSMEQLASADGRVVQKGWEDDRDTTTITYGTGKLTGEYIRDSVCLTESTPASSSAAVPQLCMEVDFLGVVQESRFPFTELPFDGIFGLGLGGLAVGPGFSFAGRLRSDAAIHDPTFAVFLRNVHADEDSEITFGGFRRDRLQDPEEGLRWLPVPDEADGKGYWIVTMRDVYIRGQPLRLCDDFSERPRCQIALDTGTSLIMGPSYQVSQLRLAIGSCSKELPTLRLELDADAGGTFDVVLGPEDYAERPGGEGCAFLIEGMDLPATLGPLWVLGQAALRKYYSIYDVRRWRVGLGLAAHTSRQRPDPPSPAPAVPVEVEACEDDTKGLDPMMAKGCRAFRDMGYCQRMPALAYQYCRRTCGRCQPPAASQTLAANAAPTPAVPAMRAGSLRAAVTTPTQPPKRASSASSFLWGPSEVTATGSDAAGAADGSALTVRGSGFGLVGERRRLIRAHQ